MFVAPCDIMILPGLSSTVTDDDGKTFSVGNYDASISEVLNAQVQQLRLRAKAGTARRPFVDMGHDDKTIAGAVQEIYYAGTTRGTRAIVIWNPVIDEVVASREYNGFSPAFIFSRGRIGGFSGSNCGALLNRFQQPRFCRMDSIQPISKWSNVCRLRKRFVELLGAEQPAPQAVAALRAARPDLAEACDLVEGYADEMATAEVVRLNAVRRDKDARERRQTEAQAEEFVRKFDRHWRATGCGDVLASVRVIAQREPALHAAYKTVHPLANSGLALST